ncbi:uncharacterized protein LOC128674563 [Plodia interpunctella]|uniref:uncharacterized protein LOC128674563 n=1 Tax=Plodia interpunctella TaxID=58824 RepID=UPI0023688A1A|nr:uncharacterized protein LOC128674563 [Plodia interpunctella]
MTDNLPLIPEKGAVCGDVRGVLRGVFRELGAPVPPAPIAALLADASQAQPDQLPALKETHWKYKYTTECEKLSRCEVLLRQEYAKRLSRSPLPNIYRVCRERAASEPSEASERSHCGQWLRRRHLAPGVRQHANREESLWVRNMQCPSEQSLSRVLTVRGVPSPSPVPTFYDRLPIEEISLYSLSIGTAQTPLSPPPSPAPPEPPLPDYILCVPQCLEFVNFVVGQEHIQVLRLINVSKAELRLSVRPPERRELLVTVGPRGQRVTAGAATQLQVSFTPRDVRKLAEDLHISVSAGRAVLVPIRCYIQPPILNVLVPLEPSQSLACNPELVPVSPAASAGSGPARGAEVVELGARLLGDMHHVPLLLQCRAKHADFFVITEDSWINYTLEGITSGGAVVNGNFAWWPAWWRGGGGARGAVWCRADIPGLHAAGFRILSSTAAVRPLCLLADSLFFQRDHITLQAHEKDYDICGETDPSCEYYVHLGTAFPGRALTAPVQLINHSPVSYAYYWTVRPWGVCSCRGEDCEGALERLSQDSEEELSPEQRMMLGGVRVEPTRGRVVPRSSCTLHVCAPDVGAQLGVQRATLMLILKDIPKESFPPGYDPMIVSCQMVDAEPMPGFQSEQREVCEVVCCEMEVWWEVAPVRFVVDPPLLRLPHSRRVEEVQVTMRATQLFGREPITAEWRLPPSLPHPADVAHLTPTQSLATRFTVPLPSLPDDATPHQKMDIIELVGADEEWRSYCTVQREAERRALRVAPAAQWLGIVAPGEHVSTDLVVYNDTYQNIRWACHAVRWCGDISGSAWCEGREPCAVCAVRGCSCALLWPNDGNLLHGADTPVRFAVYAPKRDGCVLILVDTRRAAPGDCGRTALLAFRVLAPKLVIRALECIGDHKRGKNCECCALDVVGASGAAVVRPRGPLSVGRLACCRLLVTNLTPVATTVTWEPPLITDGPLRVKFNPNEIAVEPYETVQIQVIMQAARVSLRRVFVWRAQVLHSCTPLYLVVDTDIAGVEVTVELPLGGGPEPDTTVLVRQTQKETAPALTDNPLAGSEDIFLAFEREQVEYIKRVFACRCSASQRSARNSPASPDAGRFPCRLPRVPLCLQFSQLPLHTVRRRTLVLSNVSALPARWTARVRRWPRQRVTTLAADKWAANMRDPGVAMEVLPARGQLAPGRCARAGAEPASVARVAVDVYADCAGLYHDQLLVQIENVEPIIVDVWVEALAVPLVFYSAPAGDAPPPLWMSAADDKRVIRARNATRSRQLVRAYLLKEHEDERDRELFRVYLRLEDAEPPPPTPLPSDCSTSVACELSDASSSFQPEPATNVELFLCADFGPQCLTPYMVEPEICEVEAGADVSWQVSRCEEFEDQLPSDAILMLRCEPLDKAGDNWYRPLPPPQTVQLRLARRNGQLQLSTKEVRVKICALNLPYDEVFRVRKRFHIMNVGDGPMSVTAFVRSPWSLVTEDWSRWTEGDGLANMCRCIGGRPSRHRTEDQPLKLLPRSSIEICVEVNVPRMAATPPTVLEPVDPPRYQDKDVTVTPFVIRDDQEVYAKLYLVLEIEYPVVIVEPEVINFGFVTDSHTSKTYFTVRHSSRTETLDLAAVWSGVAGFLLHPLLVRVPPGASRRVYVQYTAAWRGAPVEGKATMTSRRAAWCSAAVTCRAAPIRDHKWQPTHDYTDDPVLLPPEYQKYTW